MPALLPSNVPRAGVRLAGGECGALIAAQQSCWAAIALSVRWRARTRPLMVSGESLMICPCSAVSCGGWNE